MEKLELRMYFLVPYNISPIQQAIQAGHAALEYARLYGTTGLFKAFVEEHKTWIILNGGTTNNHMDDDGIDYKGTLNQTQSKIAAFNFAAKTKRIEALELPYAAFYEPDLNDALTALCFICDEKVFNYTDYPDLADYIAAIDFPDDSEEKLASYTIRGKSYEEIKELFPHVYVQWVKTLGGNQNVFLRELLKGKKLA